MVSSDKHTASCAAVWDWMKQVRDYIKNPNPEIPIKLILENLEDAFTDFECSWEEHAREYHT